MPDRFDQQHYGSDKDRRNQQSRQQSERDDDADPRNVSGRKNGQQQGDQKRKSNHSDFFHRNTPLPICSFFEAYTIANKPNAKLTMTQAHSAGPVS